MIPIMIAIVLNVFPSLALKMTQKIRLKMANGIPTQLNHPKNGKNPTSEPSIEIIPKIRPIVFIVHITNGA